MIKFGSDNTRISGPRVDGTMSITFECGEYMRDRVLEVMKLNPPLRVIVMTEAEYNERQKEKNS